MSWNNWIKTFSRRGAALRGGAAAGGVLASAEESTPLSAIEQLRRENDELVRLDKERGVIHRRLKKRLVQVKKEMHQQRLAARKQARELKKRAWDAEQRAKEVLAEIETNQIYGIANAARPGLLPFCLEDPEIEKRRAEILRDHVRVWKYPMRLGIFHQYSPREMIRETFPKVTTTELNLPKVSVVTPSFRQAEFLERTIKSVLGEAYPKLEYFVMDGGSSDGSVDVIKQHAASLAGWVSEKDRGASHAINKGFAQTTGDVMAWINSDDLWMPGVLWYAADFFAKHPEVDVVYGHRLIIDARDHQVGHWVLPKHDGEMLLWADFLPQETMFWRRSIWEKVGGQLDDTFSFAFDWDLLLRFQRARARMVRLPYFMGSFRVHQSQKSSAEISSAGYREMAHLRERELGKNFDEWMLQHRVIRFQKRAVRCDRLRRLGIRW